MTKPGFHAIRTAVHACTAGVDDIKFAVTVNIKNLKLHVSEATRNCVLDREIAVAVAEPGEKASTKCVVFICMAAGNKDDIEVAIPVEIARLHIAGALGL